MIKPIVHKLAATLSLVIVVALSLGAPPANATSGPGCFRIVGVASNDVLNLRSGPNSGAPLTGTMQPKRHGIIALSGSCTPQAASKSKQWCKVTHYVDSGTTIGWASRRFLSDVDCP
ncbi:MAG: SH3 domain-containing protein [Alphaproteobacteria bacterium]|nr:SH3 domain-containing protein [Alphaproteobacteria bacterium]